jgi:hypothetical protein
VTSPLGEAQHILATASLYQLYAIREMLKPFIKTGYGSSPNKRQSTPFSGLRKSGGKQRHFRKPFKKNRLEMPIL